jgi:hypothetical protein
MQVRAILLAAALMLAPLSARAADLVIWWDKGYCLEEDAAVAKLVAIDRLCPEAQYFSRRSTTENVSRSFRVAHASPSGCQG